MVTMADFETLNLTITADTAKASSSLDTLTKALSSFQSMLNSIDGTSAFNSINNISDGLTALVSGFTRLSGSMSQIEGVVDVMRTTASAVSVISNATQGLDGGNLTSLAGGIDTLSSSLRDASELLGYARFDSAATNLDAFTSAINVLQGALATFSSGVDMQSMNALATLASSLAQMNASLGNGFSSDSFAALAAGINHVATATASIDDATIDRVIRLANALNQLAAAAAGAEGMENLRMPSLGGGGSGNSARQNVQKFLQNFSSTYAGGVKKLGGLLGGAVKTGGRAASAALEGVGNAAKFMYEKFSLSTLMGNNLLSSLLRMAKMRALRAVVRAVANAFKEGMENIAHYSSEANAVLSQFSTGAQYMKNSLAASLYPAVASLVGIFSALISVAVRALNIVNMLFSVLGGKTTYIRATKQTKDFASATSGAAGAASALKQELMGFDEINALSPSGGGGGGGGGGIADYASMFEKVPVEEWVTNAIESGDYTIFGTKLAQKLNKAMASIQWTSLKKGAQELAENITEAINGFIATISPTLVAQTIAEAINTATTFVSTFWNNTNWFELGKKIGNALVAALNKIDVPTLASAITGKLRSMVTLIRGWLSGDGKNFLGTLGTKIGQLFNEMLEDIEADDLAGVLVGIIQDAANGATNLINTVDWSQLSEKINKFFSEAITGIPWSQIAHAFATLINKAARHFTLPSTQANITNITEQVVKFVTDAINTIDWSQVGLALAGIANAIVEGLNNALSGEEGKKAESSLIEGIKTFFSNINFEALIKLGSIVLDSSVGKVLTLASVAGALLPMITSATGFSLGSFITFTLPGAFEIIASISKLKQSSSSSDLTSDVASLVGKALFGAAGAYIGFVFGGTTGAALGFTVGVKIETALEVAHTASSEELLPEGTTESINSLVSTVTKSSAPLQTFVSELTTLTGITFTEDSILKLFPNIDWSNPEQSVTELTEEVTALCSALQIASENGELDKVLESLGLVGTDANEAANSVSTAASTVSDAGEKVGGAAKSLSESATDIQENVDLINGSTSTLSTTVDEMPETIMIDGSSLDGVKESASAANLAVNALYLAILGIKTALSKITDNFDPLKESAESAATEVSELSSAVSGIPDTKTVTLYTKNTTNVLNGLKKIKNALSDLKSVTISIKVKAGLTAGAKSFLTQLKTAADASTQTKISNLLNFSQFAKGGFPSSGDIFMANENGRQELVGRIGSQPAVANQDQIGDAIFKYMDQYNQGNGYTADELATAIVRGIKAAGLGATYLDGKQLSGSINKETQRSGKPAIQF